MTKGRISITSGSSPRVWRQRYENIFHLPGNGFISTCVETATNAVILKRAFKVHLHVCGDSNTSAICDVSTRGSSPRVWRQPPAAE